MNEPMSKNKKSLIKKIILLLIIVLCVLAYFFIPIVNSKLNAVFKMFATGDFNVVKEFVASYGL